jgi:hypothetical protein
MLVIAAALLLFLYENESFSRSSHWSLRNNTWKWQGNYVEHSWDVVARMSLGLAGQSPTSI